jgi:hypothetical protein
VDPGRVSFWAEVGGVPALSMHQIQPRSVLLFGHLRFDSHAWKIEFWYLASASESSVGSCISCISQ